MVEDCDCIENGGLLGVAGNVGGALAVGGGRMNIDVEVGGGGAIGGLIICSFSLVVSLTLAANVCDTTVVEVIVDVGTATLGGALLVVIMMALV